MNIVLVTPLKNELDNIDQLIESIENQTVSIKFWIIVENGSIDGSKEYLTKIQNVKNVENFILLHYSLANEKYELGEKYATIVNFGFEHMQTLNEFNQIDYIGILDSDCFPEKKYYEKLVNFMEMDKKIGISSGKITTLEGKKDFASEKWVRGSGRLWKIECFKQAGYLIGPSADTLSAAKAVILGWKVEPLKDITIYSRETGSRINYEYYGYSAYFRGLSFSYITLRTLKYILYFQIVNGIKYFQGYLKAYLKKKPKVNDPEILEYFENYLLKRI